MKKLIFILSLVIGISSFAYGVIQIIPGKGMGENLGDGLREGVALATNFWVNSKLQNEALSQELENQKELLALAHQYKLQEMNHQYELEVLKGLKEQWPDFDEVVTYENCVKLRTLYPEVASSILAKEDLYEKNFAAYAAIKKYFIWESLIKEERFLLDKEISEKKILVEKIASYKKILVSICILFLVLNSSIFLYFKWHK